MIQLQDICKTFGSKKALDMVSLTIPDGTIYGLLGPNGAGKTTLLRIMTGITMPDSGSATIDNEPISLKNAYLIGYMPEERGLYKKMKVAEQITYLARLRGIQPDDAETEMTRWLKRFDILSWKYKKIEELSKGMAQKVQFITTVIHRPKLLILDEPFSGFDPINAQQIKEEILRLNREGTSIVLSTHNMESVETLCQQLSLINNGRIILQGEVQDIKQQYQDHKFRVTRLIENADGTTEQRTEILLKEPEESNNAFLQRLAEDGQIMQFEQIMPSMNDIFIRAVNEDY